MRLTHDEIELSLGKDLCLHDTPPPWRSLPRLDPKTKNGNYMESEHTKIVKDVTKPDHDPQRHLKHQSLAIK